MKLKVRRSKTKRLKMVGFRTRSKTAGGRKVIKRKIKQQIYSSAIDIDEGAKVFVESDPDVQTAVDLLPRARALAEEAQKLVAQRGRAAR